MYEKPNVQYVMNIARDAGRIIMSYRDNPDPTLKADNSFVTKADLAASRFIMQKLQVIAPRIPAVSEEESKEKNQKIIEENDTYWMIDPLDGTKSFIEGYDGFGVHIGLIHKGKPVMGVVYFPAAENGRGKLYYTGNNGKAYSQIGGEQPQLLTVPRKLENFLEIKGAVGWGKKNEVKKIGLYKIHPVRAVGGDRLCVTAAGKAEVACFETPMSYWDIAAGHAILKAAGGELYLGKTGKPVTYDKPHLAVSSCYGAHKDIYNGCIKAGFIRRSFTRRPGF